MARQLKQQFDQKRSITCNINDTLFAMGVLISETDIGTQLSFQIDNSEEVWTTAKLKEASPKAILDLSCTAGSQALFWP